MAVISKAQLKNDFLDGTIITEDKMDDLIDSTYNESFSITKEISTLEISTINSDPVTIIDAPGPGKIIQVNNVIVNFIWGTADITPPNADIVVWGVSTATLWGPGATPFGQLSNGLELTVSGITQLPLDNDADIEENVGIIMTGVNGSSTLDPTMGASTSTLKLYLNYSIITI
jgi:hypothetical protein|tara:strand:+ start:195 stop:713 length:519 start_codon:yes stop_codon:yes gene_type:complete